MLIKIQIFNGIFGNFSVLECCSKHLVVVTQSNSSSAPVKFPGKKYSKYRYSEKGGIFFRDAIPIINPAS